MRKNLVKICLGFLLAVGLLVVVTSCKRDSDKKITPGSSGSTGLVVIVGEGS